MPPTEIFAEHPLAHWELGDTLPRIQGVADHKGVQGLIAELLLQHDVVALPTADFSILPVLLQWFGEDLLSDMLASGAFRFIRYFGSVAYHGDLREIQPYELWPEKPHPDSRQFDLRRVDGKTFRDSDVAAIADSEQAVDIYLTRVYDSRTGPLTGAALANMTRLVLQQTTEARIDFRTEVAEPTLLDIDRTKSLRVFDLEGNGLKDLDVVGPTESRVYRHLDGVLLDEQSQFDQVDLVLWMCMANFEIALARFTGSDHLLVHDPVRRMIVGRTRGMGQGRRRAEQFSDLAEAAGVPDMPAAFESGVVNLRQLWRLRESASGMKFRAWFNRALDDEAYTDIAHAYIEALSSSAPWISSVPVRSLRFLAKAAVSLFLSPAAGLAADAADLAMDKMVSPWTPKVFLDDLRRIPQPSSKSVLASDRKM